jgi:sulfonate transport system ATP-binding protein
MDMARLPLSTEGSTIAASRGGQVKLEGLCRSYGGLKVLDRIDLEVTAGSFVTLLGKSGSGKSTLLRLLTGLDRPTAGRIDVPQKRAVVFQEPRLVPWLKVRRNVTLGLRRPNADALAEAALAEVGLSHRIDAWPLTLSGGEAQRAALARGLVREPELMLLDEPFAALDALTRMNMQNLVLTLWTEHRPTVLFVTHDVDEALLLADRVLLLRNGRVAEDVAVDLPRPRQISVPGFDALRNHFLQALGVPLPGQPSTAPN